ncbi:MAG TPA: amino acid permease [Anaerolineae bacterium]|nr:amino acid permease [Anaerolineae bacterium]HQJ10556.1 amino acid permease [Anaerolineae bacterium]
MSKRKLKRQLSLIQLVMLGTIGTLGAQIFVLTGEAAALSGPATLLALLLAGLVTYVIAINYAEMATSFPETGGAMTYVREAYGSGLLSFLVGSMDCLSSTFFAALSAVGFGYSLNILFPAIPIVPAAIFILVVFSLLNIFGVSMVGNVQVTLGIIQLLFFGVYIVAGFVSPNGFHWSTLVPDGKFFVYPDAWTNFSKLLRTIVLIYIAYVGFEVIADDAEEAKDPDRMLPRALMLSVTFVMLINLVMVTVALGTIPWYELAGSKTVLTDTVARTIPGWGVTLMAICGVETMLTTINSAMLSATREAFTLGRDGAWPKALTRLSRRRTPYAAIIVVGLSSILVAATGLVDFLSYISSSGYMFVLFWASLSMIRLRKKYPNLRRPFKAPFFPLTAYIAAGMGLFIVLFTEVRALLFGVALLGVLAIIHYAGPAIGHRLPVRRRFGEPEPGKERFVVSVANPQTAKGLVYVAGILAEATVDPYICVLTVNVDPKRLSAHTARRLARDLSPEQRALLQNAVATLQERNIAVYTKVRAAPSVAEGILDEVGRHCNVNLLLLGWPGLLTPAQLAENPINLVLQKAPTNVAVLLNRGLLTQPLRRILVPVGGGPHSRMALRLAYELAEAEKARVTALRILKGGVAEDTEELEDQTLWLQEIIEEVLGAVPPNFTLLARSAKTVQTGVLGETERQPYQLIVLGASEEWASRTRLFGSVDDWIANQAPCSVLLCRRYEPVAVSWLRRNVKRIEREYEHNAVVPASRSEE